jgi:hypothetical protein
MRATEVIDHSLRSAWQLTQWATESGDCLLHFVHVCIIPLLSFSLGWRLLAHWLDETNFPQKTLSPPLVILMQILKF